MATKRFIVDTPSMPRAVVSAHTPAEAPRQITLLGDAMDMPTPSCIALAIERLPVRDGLVPDAGFVRSIARFGVIEPVVVVSDGSRLLLAGGRRRVAAARRCGMRHVPALIYAFTGAADNLEMIAALLTTMLNARRRDNALADIRAITAMRASGASDREIRQATGLTAGQLRRCERLSRLHDGLARALVDGALSPRLAEACAALPAESQATLWDKLCATQALSMHDVDAIRQARVCSAQAALALDGLAHALDEAPGVRALALHNATDISGANVPLAHGVYADIARVIASTGGRAMLRDVIMRLPDSPAFEAVRNAFASALSWTATPEP